ncbi:MAG: hypothetical protein IJG69_03860 [Spirochaetales bacterium]|nr:hypothetical protein [Spirochaetales bacterium]
MAVVLFAMVSCQDEVEPYRPEATIPSEEGGSATNFDDADAQVIQKVFTDLTSLITTFEESSKDVEKKTTVVANGSLKFDAPDNKEALHIEETSVDEQPVPEAYILYKDFEGTATLKDNVLRAVISYSATINKAEATYGIEITDFDLDEFVLSKDGLELAKDANTAEYYYASAVFLDCISNLEAKFENASVKITDEDNTVYDIDIAGSFKVDIEDFNLDAILGDDDGNPFTSGEFNIDELILGVKVTFGGDTVNANIGMKNFNITVAFNDEEEIEGSITTTTSTVTIGFGYKERSIFANYGDFIVLNVESTDDRFDLDIVTIKEEDSSVVPSKKSSSTKFNVKFNSKVGIGLKVGDNAIGLLTDLGIDVKDKSFKELDLDKDLVVTPRAALVNGKYVDPKQFYICVSGIIESMDEAE